jgi:hypothetical protein
MARQWLIVLTAQTLQHDADILLRRMLPPDAWTFTLQTETTYNWETEEWAVPVNAVVSKLTAVQGQPVSIFGGVRYWAESPDSGPEGWGLRFGVTLLFPKG